MKICDICQGYGSNQSAEVGEQAKKSTKHILSFQEYVAFYYIYIVNQGKQGNLYCELGEIGEIRGFFNLE